MSIDNIMYSMRVTDETLGRLNARVGDRIRLLLIPRNAEILEIQAHHADLNHPWSEPIIDSVNDWLVICLDLEREPDKAKQLETYISAVVEELP